MSPINQLAKTLSYLRQTDSQRSDNDFHIVHVCDSAPPQLTGYADIAVGAKSASIGAEIIGRNARSSGWRRPLENIISARNSAGHSNCSPAVRSVSPK